MRAQNNLTDQRPGHVDAPEPKSGGGLYLASWAVLASLSASYMAVLLLQPNWATPITTQSLRTEEPPPASSAVVEQLSDEVDSLRKTIADLQRELTDVKSTAAERKEAHSPIELPYGPPILLSQRETAEMQPVIPIGADPELRPSKADGKAGQGEPSPTKADRRDTAKAETPRPEPKQMAISPKSSQTEDVVRAKAGKPEPSSQVVRTAREEPNSKQATTPPPPTPVKKVVVLNAKPAEKSEPDALPFETGSLPPAPPPMITFGPPTVTPASEAVGIHLDAAPSLEALRLRWDVLHDRHRSALNGLEPRYLISGTSESPSYLLMAGPITSPDEASRICALLRARRVACSVGGPFTGQAL